MISTGVTDGCHENQKSDSEKILHNKLWRSTHGNDGRAGGKQLAPEDGKRNGQNWGYEAVHKVNILGCVDQSVEIYKTWKNYEKIPVIDAGEEENRLESAWKRREN